MYMECRICIYGILLLADPCSLVPEWWWWCFNYCPIVPMYYMSEVFLKINRENYFMEDMK